MSASQYQAKIGVKAVILRNQQLLTIVKDYPEGIAYILPGGSQNHGETLDDAIQRECYEELGTAVAIERLLFVREYIGANHKHATLDRDLHIVDIIFACNVPDVYTPQPGPEPDGDQMGVQWLPLSDLHFYRFYPAGLQAYLVHPEAAPVYIGDIN